MPTRLIRDGINSSERVNKLSQGAEIFYRRLLLETDDYGRASAHYSLLLANCFPLKLEVVKISDIEQWLSECTSVHLIEIYTIDDKNYLQLLDFKQKTRSKSKFPPPPDKICYADAQQMQDSCLANVHLGGGVFVCEGEDGCVVGAAVQTPDNTYQFFCYRQGKKTPCNRHGDYTMLTTDEHRRMVAEWGKSFTDEAILQYDTKFPNSNAIKKHTDHNRGIRDYVRLGYICAGKQPHKATPTQEKEVVSAEDLGTPEERAGLLRMNFKSAGAGVTGVQPIGDVIAGMLGSK